MNSNRTGRSSWRMLGPTGACRLFVQAILAAALQPLSAILFVIVLSCLGCHKNCMMLLVVGRNCEIDSSSTLETAIARLHRWLPDFFAASGAIRYFHRCWPGLMSPLKLMAPTYPRELRQKKSVLYAICSWEPHANAARRKLGAPSACHQDVSFKSVKQSCRKGAKLVHARNAMMSKTGSHYAEHRSANGRNLWLVEVFLARSRRSTRQSPYRLMVPRACGDEQQQNWTKQLEDAWPNWRKPAIRSSHLGCCSATH